MDQNIIEKEFPLDPDLIYLNHAAVAPWPSRTRDAVKQFAEENSYSGAKNYLQWEKKESQLRQQIQRLLNAASTNDIALLKNTSEALSVVASGLEWLAGDNVVSSTEEFPSNCLPWQAQSDKGVEFREVNIRVDNPEEALIAACDDRTRIIAISSVQYGSGIRLNLKLLGQFCKEKNILFCVDAIQSIGACALDVQAIEADFVMADAHKWMLGPEGIALFYTSAEARDKLKLYQYGWHMVEKIDYAAREWQIARSARRFECGSMNMLGIFAMSASLSLIDEIGIQQIENSILNNSSYLIDNLKDIKGLHFLTPEAKKRHAGIVNFTIDHIELRQLQHKLLKENIICVYRSGGLRLSPHYYTSQEKLNKTVDIIKLTI